MSTLRVFGSSYYIYVYRFCQFDVCVYCGAHVHLAVAGVLTDKFLSFFVISPV